MPLYRVLTSALAITTLLTSCAADENERDGDPDTAQTEQGIVSSCTVSLSAAATSVAWGTAIALTASPTCPGSAIADVEWFHRLGTSGAWTTIAGYGPATTLSFDTTTAMSGTQQFYAAVRAHGSSDSPAKSATVSVTVYDGVPACTAVKVTTPTPTTVGRVGEPLPVAATVTCPAGTTGEFQLEVRPSTTTTWTIDPSYVIGSTTWTPPSAGIWEVRVGARANGSHGKNQVTSAQVQLTVVAPTTNRNPVAANDSATTQKNGPIAVDVAANDHDPDGDALSVSAVGTPSHGTAAAAGTVVTYRPALDYVGADSVTYTVSDGRGGTATARLSIAVTAPLGTCTVSVTPMTASALQAVPIHLTASATCTQGAGIEYAWYSRPGTTGAFALARDWSATAAAIDLATPDFGTFQWFALARTAQAEGRSTNATLTVIEDVPQCTSATVVSPASHSTHDLGVVSLAASAVCPPGVTAEFQFKVRPVVSATWTVLGDFSSLPISWSPPAAGDWQVKALVRSQGAHTVQATSPALTFTVVDPDHAPIAGPDLIVVDEDLPTLAFSLLWNDSDPDGDPLMIESHTLPTHGTVDLEQFGTMIYTPFHDYNGFDSFSYTISDGRGMTATATATIIVTPVEDPPIAVPDVALTTEDQPVTVDVIANDFDADGDSLTVYYADGASHGNLQYGGGSVTYTPAHDFSGTDSFFYCITDIANESMCATVDVTVTPVNDAPLATDSSVLTAPGSAVDITLAATDAENDSLVYSVDTGPTHGTLSAIAGAQITYTPTPGFSGIDSFTYTANDGVLISNVATVTISIRTQSSQFAQISAGLYHTCGITTSGDLWCWGQNSDGKLGDGSVADHAAPVHIGTETWSSVSVGWYDTCGIQTSGTLWCWGANWTGGLGTGLGDSYVPARVGTNSDWSSVSAAALHTCATRTDGTLWCWGDGWLGMLGSDVASSLTPLQVGELGGWSKVTTGYYDSCAIRDDETLWCWGGLDGGGFTPSQIGTATWASIDGGQTSRCGIQTDHTLWCWGGNWAGQLGTGDTTNVSAPIRVGTDASWSGVSVGDQHACATRSDDTLWCWGGNDRGQVGDGTQSTRLLPVPVAPGTQWIAVTAGESHTCGLINGGRIECWGTNTYGEAGHSRFPNKLQPSPVHASVPFVSLATASDSSCGIETDGTLWCWGRLGNTTFAAEPMRIGSSTTWSSISGAVEDFCAIQTDGTLWCWGRNQYGELGDGTYTRHDEPQQVGTESTWSTISVGGWHTCATRTDGTVWCWGLNVASGLPSSVYSTPDPTQIGTDADWSTVSAGERHTCATRTNGTLWCWGVGSDGQLGNGSSETLSPTPTQVGPGTLWASVSAGQDHTCGIQADQSLWCWGYNDHGELGDGTLTHRYVPTAIGVGTTWSSISATSGMTCGTQTDGTRWCWGVNYNGALGDGTLTDRLTPTEGDTTLTWTRIVSNINHTCGLASDGTGWCWGDGSNGQLGDGDAWRLMPTAVAFGIPGLVAYWTGDDTADDSAGGRVGTLIGDASYTDGHRGRAFQLGGNGGVTASSLGLPVGAADRTMAEWVRIDAYASGESFFSGYGAFGSFNEVYVLGATGSTPFFSQWGEGLAASVIPLGEWHHLAATNVGSAVTLYLDGVAVGTQAMTIATATGTDFLIGYADDYRKLTGAVDEVRIYDRALSAAEIATLYAAP